MATMAAESGSLQLAAYDRGTAQAMLRDWTPRRLANELRAGSFGARLTSAQWVELQALLTAWSQRALAELSLRDALLVDERRGRRVFALICAALTTERVAVPPTLAPTPDGAPVELAQLPPALAGTTALAALAERADRDGLALVLQRAVDDYPYPANLEALVVPLQRRAAPAFEQPTGWRRRIAALLAMAGVLALGVPLLVGGRIPENPAGWPLALLTLALLVGIRAGWPGYAGSLCIWLVANLPGFRHGTQLAGLLPALPLLAAGLLLLSRDGRVRAMWRWLRGLLRPRRPS